MLKPLLKVLPTLSGNVKLVCEVNKYEQVSNDTFNGYVRSAKMLPLSSQLSVKPINVFLSTSSYEIDIKKFFEENNQYFYQHYFDYNKTDYKLLDKYNNNKNRNTDFEFGLKRISYLKNGYQFAFFAPIYIESENDIPDYFKIKIEIKHNSYVTVRYINININQNNNSDNYLCKYLTRYSKKINSNVIFCLPHTNQATYDGIDLRYGCIDKITDNIFGKLYKNQMTIHNFDAIISKGWERNKMCMKQIIPLSFYFNVNDILSPYERELFSGAKLNVSGEYYKNNKECKFYSIDTNYVHFNQEFISLNPDNGVIQYNMNDNNILDMPYPALNESRFIGYEYSNKINHSYNRWKMKYSDDKHPYIINMSPAFSLNQNSIVKYCEYPKKYNSVNIISDIDNNLVIPFGSAKSNLLYNINQQNKYINILNEHISNWFDVIKDFEWYKYIKVYSGSELNLSKEYFRYDEKTNSYIKYSQEEILEKQRQLNLPNGHPEDIQSFECYEYNSLFTTDWVDVVDDKAYCKGILYDLSNIYVVHPDIPHIDKFNVILRANFEPINKSVLDKIKEAKYSIYNNDIKYITKKNCFVSESIELNLNTNSFNENAFNFFKGDTELVKNEVELNNIFVEHIDKSSDGDFINLSQYNFDYYNANTYYKLSNIKKQFSSKNTKFIGNINNILQNSGDTSSKYIEGYEFLNIYTLNNLYDDNNNFIFEQEQHNHADWIIESQYDKLYFSDDFNYYKARYNKTVFFNLDEKLKNEKYRLPLYLKDTFISKQVLKTIIFEQTPNVTVANVLYNAFDELDEYEYLPILKLENKNVGKNVFVRRNTFSGRMYGDNIPSKYYKYDNNILYVDQYNLNNVIKAYNKKYGNDFKTYGDGNNDTLDINSNYISTELYGKFLNKLHLRYYFNTLYTDVNLGNIYNNSENPHPLFNIYIKVKHIYNDYISQNLYVKDNYIRLADLYENEISSQLNTVDDEAIKNELDFICDDIIVDLIYKNGYWQFSNKIISNNKNIWEKLGITITDNVKYNIEDFYFELYYKKRFIKVDKNIYDLINLSKTDDIEKPYKDLYLYTLQPDTNVLNKSKYYYDTIDSEEYKKSFETTYSLIPVFDSIFMQDKKDTVIYKEFNQNKISTVKYTRNNDGNYYYHYRYNVPDVNVMYDISNYDGYPIISTSELTNEKIYYYPNSYSYTYTYKYVNNVDITYDSAWLTYLMIEDEKNTAYQRLTTFDLINNNKTEIAQATTYSVETTYNIVDTFEDLSVTYTGYNVSYSYYSENRFNRLYPTESMRNNISYDIIIDEKTNNKMYVTYNYTTYSYYNTVNTYAYAYTYNYVVYDDLGIYNNFKINTYTVPYTQTYTYIVTKQYIDTVSSETNEFVSYNVIKYIDEEHIGYTYGTYTYGFYLIDTHFDNTRGSFNLIGVDNLTKKSFTYINENYIYGKNYNIIDIYKLLLPSLKSNPFNVFQQNNNIINKPQIYKINNIYKQSPLNDMNNVTYAYDILLNNKNNNSTISLERYFNAIVPYIKEVNILENTYCLKYKDKNTSVQSINYANNVLYTADLPIYNYTPMRIYDTINNTYEKYTPLEYKYFNDNIIINLPETITIEVGNNLTIHEVNNYKIEDNIFKTFKEYINNGEKYIYNNDDMLFLYNRYEVKCYTECTGLNSEKTEKIYTLTYKFILL